MLAICTVGDAVKLLRGLWRWCSGYTEVVLLVLVLVLLLLRCYSALDGVVLVVCVGGSGDDSHDVSNLWWHWWWSWECLLNQLQEDPTSL